MEEEKKDVKEPTVPAMESTTNDDGSSLGSLEKTDKKEKSSDDFYYEKFRKRARDNWRYQ